MTAGLDQYRTQATTGHRRLLPASRPGLDEHAREHGPLPRAGRDLIATVGAAGLTGRGGAGFPTARKLAAVARGRRPVVVANGAEGEPASAKDRTLLGHAPQLVLDGLQLVAEAMNAARVVAYVPAGAAGRLLDTVAHRRTVGWDRRPVEIVVAPDAFIAGEESAVVAAIEGGPALPRDKRRLIVEAGVRGAPTLVQNVETLAHIALIARHGADWFRTQGTAEEPGTFLATVGGAVAAGGVYEAPYGVSLAGLITAAGGVTAPLQAVLVGGYHGAWVPADPELPISRAGLRRYGASPGAGVVMALPAGVCGLLESTRIAGYLAGENAGQCGPCVNGLPRLADTLARLAHGVRDPRLPGEVARLSALVAGRGACHHPDGTARFIASSLRAFAAEVDLHLAGACSARPAATLTGSSG